MSTSFSINLSAISKRYGMQWIFRDLDYSFSSGTTYAIRGYNGSGKSTLLRILSTMESPNQGQRIYQLNGEALKENKVASYLSFAAPYMDLPGHLKVIELLQFHSSFKKMQLSPEALLSDINLKKSKDQLFDTLSSGQKQKIKLALVIQNDDPLLLLDEPGTNLDEDNYQWFSDRLKAVKQDKLICIATNEARDLDVCDAEINVMNFVQKQN